MKAILFSLIMILTVACNSQGGGSSPSAKIAEAPALKTYRIALEADAGTDFYVDGSTDLESVNFIYHHGLEEFHASYQGNDIEFTVERRAGSTPMTVILFRNEIEVDRQTITHDSDVLHFSQDL